MNPASMLRAVFMKGEPRTWAHEAHLPVSGPSNASYHVIMPSSLQHAIMRLYLKTAM